MKFNKTFILSLCLFLIAIKANTSEPNFELKAPETFKAKFVTTKGDFEISSERKWSPLAVDRLYQLIKSSYFNNIPIYRGVKDFVIQFGTVDNYTDSVWSAKAISDEPVLKKNEYGVMSFARAGKESRGTTLFINLKNNARLDTINAGGVIGYPGVAYIIKGIETINKICVEYGNEPMQKFDSVQTNIAEFLKNKYPNIDYILSAEIIEN